MTDDKGEDKKPGLLTLGWFQPLYRRVIVLVVIAGWSVWEWGFNGDQFWGVVTLAMLAYAVWTFFINYDKALAKLQQDNAKPKS
ncbi:DUF3329 domain-containing protein [Devosia sp.]|jgi:hypothetical protein|uniref:DUF3329 domain-containing protein n=1 Tax=Devosia sp. TaxID=1871048 RepID=UPI0037BF3E11